MIQSVQKLLTLNNYSNHIKEYEELFLSHPNYPSIYAVTDTLDALGVENIAAKVPKEQLIELPDSFLAMYNDELTLVSKNTSSIYVENDKQKKEKLSFNTFLEKWSGVVIAIEKNETIQPKNEIVNNNKYLFFVVALLCISLLQLQKLSTLYFINFEIYIVGFFLSVLILDEKYSQSPGITSKICNLNKNTSCESVIKSENAQLNKWVDFSDLPILFYSVATLTLLLNVNLINTFNSISLLSLPIIIYSIWMQKVKLKKWCLLCLAISLLFITQALFFNSEFTFIQNFSAFIIASIIIIPLWFQLKSLIIEHRKNQDSNRELIKFKRNYDVFNFLLKPIQSENHLKHLNPIKLGNSKATSTLTLILSPSCGHCHTAYSDALNLIKLQSSKINLRVLFNLNVENKDNPYLAVAENLLQINKSTPQKIEEALSDWHIMKMPLEQWTAKWKQEEIQENIQTQLVNQYNWCLENEFNYTPVKIINNQLFPTQYSIEEAKYFLNDFEEKLQPETV